MTDKERAYYTEHIRGLLSEDRFQHSVNVSHQAVKLAQIYGCDLYQAELAGLLHDVMKDVGKKEQLALMEKYGVQLSEIERNAPKLWHAIAGAVYVQKVLNIENEDVLNAIRYHTTGRAGMSLLEKIIYIADCTSEERNYKGVERIRKLAVSDLDDVMVEALADSLEKRLADHTAMHPDTVEAYNEVILARKKQ